MKRKLTDKSEVERQVKEEVLATQKGLEKVFREMNQLKKNEQKTQETLEKQEIPGTNGCPSIQTRAVR